MEQRKTRTGEEGRTPLERAIGLRFKHFEDFIDELAANISTGGMFIRSPKPHPVGSVFEFEFRLGSDRPPIAGKAQVAWVRRRSDTLDKPVGMGVRFVELDDEGRRHIAELVAAQEETGRLSPEIEPPIKADVAVSEEANEDDKPAPTTAPDAAPHSVEPVAAAADDEVPNTATPFAAPHEQAAVEPVHEPTPPKDTERAVGAPATTALATAITKTEEPRRSRLPWILLTIVLVVALAATFWRQPSPETPPSNGGLAPPVELAGTGASNSSPAPQVEGEQLRAIDDWALAWSEQRVDNYLEAYSANFTPEGLDRAAWERQRRTRILAPQWIKVGLAFVELEETDADSGKVRFVQAYESDAYSDVVRKVLEVEREADGWKIVRETVVP